jgi:hypothetical protein
LAIELGAGPLSPFFDGPVVTACQGSGAAAMSAVGSALELPNSELLDDLLGDHLVDGNSAPLDSAYGHQPEVAADPFAMVTSDKNVTPPRGPDKPVTTH